MSTPPMTRDQAIRAAGATQVTSETRGNQLTHCGQPMRDAAGLQYTCTVCQIQIGRLDATNPADIPGSSRLWIVRHQPPSRIQ